MVYGKVIPTGLCGQNGDNQFILRFGFIHVHNRMIGLDKVGPLALSPALPECGVARKHVLQKIPAFFRELPT